MRTASLDLYAGERAEPFERLPDLPDGTTVERVAGGFEFTEGPVWSPDGTLLFSSPNTDAISRLDPELERVTVFRSKSGYAGVDIGRYHQPGSNGLAFGSSSLPGSWSRRSTSVTGTGAGPRRSSCGPTAARSSRARRRTSTRRQRPRGPRGKPISRGCSRLPPA